jgi:hypothetical protein
MLCIVFCLLFFAEMCVSWIAPWLRVFRWPVCVAETYRWIYEKEWLKWWFDQYYVKLHWRLYRVCVSSDPSQLKNHFPFDVILYNNHEIDQKPNIRITNNEHTFIEERRQER